ncbi:hypothetical protein [Streptomyces sp. NPDC001980]|uniref:hypothetical protein n=1 Tax=Streptomyces sp. NPDC001980 TaxID=3157126 RepID=UPI00332BEC7B
MSQPKGVAYDFQVAHDLVRICSQLNEKIHQLNTLRGPGSKQLLESWTGARRRKFDTDLGTETAALNSLANQIRTLIGLVHEANEAATVEAKRLLISGSGR